MSHSSNGWLLRSAAAAVVFGAAYVLSGVGFAGPADDPPKAGKKAADAPKADDKKADDKKPGFDPKDVRIGPPPELAALRAAVEEAARKGENVDEIRKQLDSLEKALAGKAWVKPKVVEDPPAPPAFPGGLQPFPQPPFPGGGRPFPVRPVVPFPGGLQINQPDKEMIQKAQGLLTKAARLALEDPVANKEKVEALQREAQELMVKAMRPAAGGLMPLLPGARGGNGRLGVRVEKVPAGQADRGILVAEVLPGSAAEKAGLKAGDVIVEFAGKPVSDDPTEFVRTVYGMKNGEKVDIVYVRNGKKSEAKGVPLADAVPAARLGAEFAPFLAPDFVPLLDPNPLPDLGFAPAEGAKRTNMSVKVENGTFTINAEQDGVKVYLEGRAEGGKPVPSKIEVTDGKKKMEAKSVDQLPAEYRDRVQKLLDGVKGGK
ncbi:MAG: mucD 1 [Gemmataceae bacterium]|nr:mucD 1 [Gemmataceae bacterium]